MSTSKGMPGYSDFEHNKISHINTTIQKDILEHWSLRNPLHLNLPPLGPGYGRGTVDCSDCIAKVLDFMYLGKIQIQKEHVDHIRSISTVLDVSELLLICDKYNEKYASQTKRKLEVQCKQQFPKKLKKDAVSTDVQHDVNAVNNDETKLTEEAVYSQKGGERSDTGRNIGESEHEPLA
jgi:ABC-type transporter lipoprotein component MlaA